MWVCEVYHKNEVLIRWEVCHKYHEHKHKQGQQEQAGVNIGLLPWPSVSTLRPLVSPTPLDDIVG